MALRMVHINSKPLGHEIQFYWSTIFTGAFLTLGFGLFFLLLGNAVGLNMANSVSTTISGALRFWSWIYAAVSMVFSYYLGSTLSTHS